MANPDSNGNGNERDYYAGRAETARRLAGNAADAHIATIHHEMAERYDALVKRLSDDAELMAA